MNFIRMGDVNLDEFELRPRHQYLDGSCLCFNLLNTDVLQRAHFYDVIKKASLSVYVTYIVEVNCVMQSGHAIKMCGQCTPNEYRCLLNKTEKIFR